MPFTFSHPAAVLPLRNSRYLSIAGLILGSIIPDFEYFIRFKSKFSHELPAILWLNLPAALLAGFLLFCVIKDPLLDNSPRFIRERLDGLRRFSWVEHLRRHFFAVCLSIIIGAATHIFWDSFTHRLGYFVQLFNILRESVLIAGQKIAVYRIIQHVSTIVGGCFVLYIFIKLPKNYVGITDAQFKSKAYWAIFIAITAITFAALYNVYAVSLWHQVIKGIIALLCGLTVAGLSVRLNVIIGA